MSGKSVSGAQSERQVTFPLHKNLGSSHYKLTEMRPLHRGPATCSRSARGRPPSMGLALVRRAAAGANPVQAVTMSGPVSAAWIGMRRIRLRVGRAVAWQDALAQASGSARARSVTLWGAQA